MPEATLISFYYLLFPIFCPARSIISSSNLAFVEIDMFLYKYSSKSNTHLLSYGSILTLIFILMLSTCS